MRIGVIVEGMGEVLAFQKLIPKIQTPHVLLHTPLRADMQPRATEHVIARQAEAAVAKFVNQNVDMILILIDSEGTSCPHTFPLLLKNAFETLYGEPKFEVVLKDRAIENWLIADIDALKKSPARFNVTNAFVNQVAPNRADAVGKPCELLNSIVHKGDYRKGRDPETIMKHQDPLRVATNSRSFRKFLRVVGCPTYGGQSRKPQQ